MTKLSRLRGSAGYGTSGDANALGAFSLVGDTVSFGQAKEMGSHHQVR